MTFTTLRSGLTLPDAAILLAISLEQRQHRLSAKDGALLVSDGSRLTAEDRAQIRTWKQQLLAILISLCPSCHMTAEHKFAETTQE